MSNVANKKRLQYPVDIEKKKRSFDEISKRESQIKQQ